MRQFALKPELPPKPSATLPLPPSLTAMDPRQRRFRLYAWGVLAYTVLVILWGGFVRATGSGAGCGSHWPLCNGDVVPRAAATATLIEFTHRITSGLALLAVVGLLVWAFRAWPKGSPVRTGAVWSMVFMVTEALVGAGLVLFEMVAYNVSVARGYWMAAHLVNTFFLLGALTLTAWWASGGGAVRLRGQGACAIAAGAAIVATLVLGASGAVTALGDTLAIGGGIDPAEEPIVAALVGMRVYHPLLAVVVFAVVAGCVAFVRARGASPTAQALGLGVVGLFALQLGIGLVNVALMAPVWLQIVHLLVTDLIWMGLVLFAAAALEATVPALDPA